MIASQSIGEKLSVKEAIKYAELAVSDLLSDYLQTLPSDYLSQLLGNKNQALQEEAVKKYKQKSTAKVVRPTVSEATPKTSKISMTNFFRNL
jgi:hypothetical protein